MPGVLHRIKFTLVIAACGLGLTGCAHRLEAAADPGLDRAFALMTAACPLAESEERETCAYSVIQQIDERLHASMCAYDRANCEETFAAFVSSRDALAHAYMSALIEGSVVNRVDTALYALRVTAAFEEQAHLDERREDGLAPLLEDKSS